MRCSCAKPATISIPRREMPYCEDCFIQLLARLTRTEAGAGPVTLRSTEGFYGDAATKLLSLARREVQLSDSGFIPGCQDTQARAVLNYQFGITDTLEQHFPASITRQELQMFMRCTPPEVDEIDRELAHLEQTYPGTIASISKVGLEARQSSKAAPADKERESTPQ